MLIQLAIDVIPPVVWTASDHPWLVSIPCSTYTDTGNWAGFVSSPSCCPSPLPSLATLFFFQCLQGPVFLPPQHGSVAKQPVFFLLQCFPLLPISLTPGQIPSYPKFSLLWYMIPWHPFLSYSTFHTCGNCILSILKFMCFIFSSFWNWQVSCQWMVTYSYNGAINGILDLMKLSECLSV